VLFQRGVGIRLELEHHASLHLRSFLRRTPWDRLWPYMPLVSPLFHLPFDGCHRDAKELHSLGAGDPDPLPAGYARVHLANTLSWILSWNLGDPVKRREASPFLAGVGSRESCVGEGTPDLATARVVVCQKSQLA
jgi:hypothetical protein